MTSRLYEASQVAAVLDRMAAAAEATLSGFDHPVLVGLLRRGVPIAEGLQQRLGLQVPLLKLEVKRYGDDLTLLHPQTHLGRPLERSEIEGRTALVIDDVLYQGFTLLRVCQHLADLAPARILSAVLVDRRALRVPVTASIVGITLEVAPTDVVECHVPPYEPEWAIDVVHRS